MPGIGGIEATRQIVKNFPGVKVLALSSHYDYDYIRQMLEAGAVGYLVKDALVTDLVTAIHTAQSGSTILSREAAVALLMSDEKAAHMTFNLTKRELEVLTQMGSGLTDSQIAHNLAVSKSTIRFHQNNVLNKMDVSTRSEALVLAARQGLI
jgi:DNA-binding NarL/FixJ family response regulator